MAAIRIPSYALDLLPFCQRSEEAGEETCFETFAHLIVTAACLGFRLEEGRVRQCESFLKTPAPIDLAIFRSQRLFDQLLIITVTGAQKTLRVVFGAHHIVEIEELPGGNTGFRLVATHHDFEADASEPGGSLDEIIELVRESRQSMIDCAFRSDAQGVQSRGGRANR